MASSSSSRFHSYGFQLDYLLHKSDLIPPQRNPKRSEIMSYRERSDSYSHRSVTRSASPDSRHHHRHQHHHVSRSRSPAERSSRRSRHHHHHHSHHRHRHDRHSEKTRRTAAPVELPFGARQLSKRDLPLFEPMFAMYLDIQKGIIMEDLSDEEVKGRWKSFIGKW